MWVVIERRMKGEGGSEIQWRDRSNREHGFRDSCFTARPGDKAQQRDSPRKFSIFFRKPMFPGIVIGGESRERDRHILLSHDFGRSFFL